MTFNDLLNYYAGLLIIQYRIKPKAKATIKLLVNQSICDGLVQTEQDCFDLDTAYGVQLTVLGKIVGVPRNVYGLDLAHTYFNFTRALTSIASNGFGRANEQPDSLLFYRAHNYAIYTMTDFEMRTAIYLKIIFNNKYSSFKDLKEAIYAKFGNDINIGESPIGRDTSGYTYFNFTRSSGTPASNGFARASDDPYIDYFYRGAYSGLMQITYTVKNMYANAIAAAIYLKIIPKPMGVGVNAIYY